MNDQETGFLSRWVRRKALAARGEPVPAAPIAAGTPVRPVTPVTPVTPAAAVAPVAPVAPQPPAAALEATTADARPALAEPPAEAVATPAPPTLADAQALKPDSLDFSRFVARDVDPMVQHQALKTLFSDPHFNVMDGLDTYIDDYNTPDPLPAGMLRKMVQSSLLRLFDDEDDQQAAGKTTAALPPPAAPVDAPGSASAITPPHPPTYPSDPAPDEDPAVRLQPDDAAGPAGDQSRPGADAQHQH